MGCRLWDQLQLDEFWRERLPDSREGTCWRQVLETLTVYRLIDPGSEWRLHRQWLHDSAMADLLGEDFGLAQKDHLYRCLDKVLAHRPALFQHLRQRWEDLFGAKFEVLLYDLTSTYFESDPPFPEGDKRQYGYSRDKRSDCVQVVIALVVTPEGFPLAYEVMAGQHGGQDDACAAFLERIEELYGKAERVWVMDRGIPTEEVLAEMRASDPPIYYLVGTPKGRLSQYEAQLLEQPWQAVRAGVQVKLLSEEGELYVLAESQDRVNKERSMRRRQLKRPGQTPQGAGPDGTDPGPTAAQTGRGQKPVSRPPGGWSPSKCRTRKRRGVGPISASRCGGTSCARCGGGRGGICCAATSAPRTRRSCGSFTCN